ncbi:MAG: hypothetical protein IPK39_15875 [Sulfuritalea sp.]|nr:hypothetical protein [Sulfuritalea sp.]
MTWSDPYYCARIGEVATPSAGGNMSLLFNSLFGERDAMKKFETVKPEKVTYEQWKDEQIKLGLADLDAGRVVSHADVVKRGKALVERLKRKHAKAA